MTKNIISPAYVCFYLLPAVWVSKEPTVYEWENKNDNSLFEIVHKGNINSKIRYKIRRDGLVILDCNNWEAGTYTKIPQHDLKPGMVVPKVTIEKEKLAEKRAYNRSMLVNAYQCCLHTANIQVHNTAYSFGLPIQSRDLVNLISFDNPGVNLYFSNGDPYCEHVIRVINDIVNRKRYDHDKRQLIELDVIDYSFSLLGDILDNEYEETLKLVELLFWSQNAYRDCSFANSLIMSWAVCEKLINNLWSKHISSIRKFPDGNKRINNKRKQKLEGRDFTASIVCENLELLEIIPHSLYGSLETIRSKRNNWLHSLQNIEGDHAVDALRVSTELLHLATGIKIHLGLSRVAPGTGGFPEEMYKI